MVKRKIKYLQIEYEDDVSIYVGPDEVYAEGMDGEIPTTELLLRLDRVYSSVRRCLGIPDGFSFKKAVHILNKRGRIALNRELEDWNGHT